MLNTVRGSNTIPIPFPTQFCNMIYLKSLTSEFNNFSGFFERRKLIFKKALFHIFIGPIPIELTRLVGLRRLNLRRKNFLTGFIERKIGFIFIFWF